MTSLEGSVLVCLPVTAPKAANVTSTSCLRQEKFESWVMILVTCKGQPGKHRLQHDTSSSRLSPSRWTLRPVVTIPQTGHQTHVTISLRNLNRVIKCKLTVTIYQFLLVSLELIRRVSWIFISYHIFHHRHPSYNSFSPSSNWITCLVSPPICLKTVLVCSQH
jgi:hypothetical protein